MRPPPWHPPVDPSPAEQTIFRLIKRVKLFVFLRQHRDDLFDDAFQTELATIYKDSPFGQEPVPPAQLALATILQAYTGVSDDEVIEAPTQDGRPRMRVYRRRHRPYLRLFRSMESRGSPAHDPGSAGTGIPPLVGVVELSPCTSIVHLAEVLAQKVGIETTEGSSCACGVIGRYLQPSMPCGGFPPHVHGAHPAVPA